MLGHSDISSTQIYQIYALVTINDLSRVFYETHPATRAGQDLAVAVALGGNDQFGYLT